MKFPKPNVYELYVKPNGKKSTFTITNTAGSNQQLQAVAGWGDNTLKIAVSRASPY